MYIITEEDRVLLEHCATILNSLYGVSSLYIYIIEGILYISRPAHCALVVGDVFHKETRNNLSGIQFISGVRYYTQDGGILHPILDIVDEYEMGNIPDISDLRRFISSRVRPVDNSDDCIVYRVMYRVLYRSILVRGRVIRLGVGVDSCTSSDYLSSMQVLGDYLSSGG